MNRLSDLTIQSSYTTDDDVISFYNQTLSCAIEYRRISAYFSTGFYRFIEKGLTELLKNGGNMKLVLSSSIDKDSFTAIRDGYILKNSNDPFINDCIENKVFELNSIKNKISIISYLIAIDKLDVKFAFLKHGGILHEKLGIIKDSFNNILTFTGSNNETEAALAHNRENFKVQLNWDEPGKRELDSINKDIQEFENVWSNEIVDGIVVPMSELIKEGLIDNIDYDFIKQYVTEPDFIRLSIDSEYIIRIQSNGDISRIKRNYLFRTLRNFVNEETATALHLQGLVSINDIVDVKNIIKSIADSLNVKLIITEQYRTIINKYYLDLENLSKLGLMIKDNDYINENNSFLEFKNYINTIVKRPLKDAQIKAAFHIIKMKRAMNFSVPGSGKTASVLGAFEYLKQLPFDDENHVDRLLVIGPLNCFKAWKDEYKAVSLEYVEDNTQIVDIKDAGNLGSKITYLKYDFERAKIILVNFESIVGIADLLSNIVDEKTMVVFDEIHRIKNFYSAKLPACLKVVDKTNYRVALTGTPLPNGYSDLYCMFNLLFGDFAKSYFQMTKEGLQQLDKDFEEEGIESKSLNDKIFPFFVRINKDDLNVPKANDDHIIVVEASEYENEIYNRILDGEGSSFGKIIRLNEVSCIPEKALKDVDFSCDIDLDFDNVYYENKMTNKIEKLLDCMKTINGKCVIWCNFVSTIEKVYDVLCQKGYKVAKIYGNIGQEERNSIIDLFNKTDKIDILVTNPHTLAESVSLHKKCHNAIYLEINYNLAQFLQSKDRIHRLGLLDTDVTNYYIFMNKYNDDLDASIDQVIYKRLLKKEKRMLAAIDAGSIIYRDIITNNEYDEIINELKRKVI